MKHNRGKIWLIAVFGLSAIGLSTTAAVMFFDDIPGLVGIGEDDSQLPELEETADSGSGDLPVPLLRAPREMVRFEDAIKNLEPLNSKSGGEPSNAGSKSALADVRRMNNYDQKRYWNYCVENGKKSEGAQIVYSFLSCEFGESATIKALRDVIDGEGYGLSAEEAIKISMRTGVHGVVEECLKIVEERPGMDLADSIVDAASSSTILAPKALNALRFAGGSKREGLLKNYASTSDADEALRVRAVAILASLKTEAAISALRELEKSDSVPVSKMAESCLRVERLR